MKIKLVKEWQNGDDLYKPSEYQILEVPDEIGNQLIEDGLAEKHNPKVDNVIIVKEVETEQAKLEAMVDAKLAAQSEKKRPPFGEAAEKLDKTAGYDELWQFANDVYKAGPGGRSISNKLATWDKSVKTAGHMAEGDQVQGGYLVPTEFRAMLMENLIEASLIRSRAQIIPMQSNAIKIPTVEDWTHASSTHGGIALVRPGEAGQKDPTKPAFGQIELTLHKLCGIVYVSDELLEDSPISIAPLMSRMFSEAFAWQEDEDFIWGTGGAMPLGIMNAACLVSQPKETDQVADTIVTDNILKMWSRLRPRGMGSAVWFAHNDCFPQLAKLEMAVGTGGSAVGLVQSVPGAPYQTILGRPLILTEHCDTIGDAGDILLCDWRQYLIGQKAGASAIATASSIHLKFDYDEIAYRFVMRYDGQPWESSTFTTKRSTITQSSFISLAARA